MVQQLFANFLELCWRGPIQDVFCSRSFERWTNWWLLTWIRGMDTLSMMIGSHQWMVFPERPVKPGESLFTGGNFILVVSTRWHRFFGLANGERCPTDYTLQAPNIPVDLDQSKFPHAYWVSPWVRSKESALGLKELCSRSGIDFFRKQPGFHWLAHIFQWFSLEGVMYNDKDPTWW